MHPSKAYFFDSAIGHDAVTDADTPAMQLRATLAAEITKALDQDGLSVRAAHRITGVAAADFSRLRQARLETFKIERLMAILDRLNREVQVSIAVVPRDPSGQGHLHLIPA